MSSGYIYRSSSIPLLESWCLRLTTPISHCFHCFHWFGSYMAICSQIPWITACTEERVGTFVHTCAIDLFTHWFTLFVYKRWNYSLSAYWNAWYNNKACGCPYTTICQRYLLIQHCFCTCNYFLTQLVQHKDRKAN